MCKVQGSPGCSRGPVGAAGVGGIVSGHARIHILLIVGAGGPQQGARMCFTSGPWKTATTLKRMSFSPGSLLVDLPHITRHRERLIIAIIAEEAVSFCMMLLLTANEDWGMGRSILVRILCNYLQPEEGALARFDLPPCRLLR